MVYYNEINPYAAQWLRNLIAAGHIAAGEVDERSIVDVKPEDLRGFTQCHFFAGIGVWSHALRSAGWPDDRPVWTGSCPCQPFSVAGKRKGAEDERHLWPAWFDLVRQCRPDVVFGEQVSSKDALAWLDAVQADLEGAGYAVGALDTCAAGVGAPHLRQRLYWVAEPHRERLDRVDPLLREDPRPDLPEVARGGAPGELAHPGGARHDRSQDSGADPGDARARPETEGRWAAGRQQPERGGPAGELADPEVGRSGEGGGPNGGPFREGDGPQHRGVLGDALRAGPQERPRADNRQGAVRDEGPASAEAGPVNGFWRDAEYVWCRDEKYRPVEPISQSLVDGSTQSLGPLRSSEVEEIVEEVKNAMSEAVAREALLDLWNSLTKEAIRRPVGRFHDVREAPILLAFLRQLAQQGWVVAQGIPCSRQEIQEAQMRMLLNKPAIARPSCRRGLDKQLRIQSSNAVRVLSSILARHAQKTWGEAFDENASATHPLAYGVANRVGRLRATGNALVAPLAEEFVRSYLTIW